MRLRVFFMRSLIALFIGLITGLLLFGGVNPVRVPMDLFEPSIISAIAVGLGWIPFFSPVTPDVTWLWGLMCLVVELAGVFALLRIRQGRLILLAIACQVAMVILAPLIKGYFLSPRNFVHLLPWMFFLAAVGVDGAWRLVNGFLKEKPEKRFFQQKKQLPIGMGIIFAACLIPALAGYYASDKGSAREISQMVRMTWEQNTPIYIMPGNELNLFQYYLIDAPDVPFSSDTLIPTDWGSISDLSSQEQERAIIITGEMAPNGYQEILLQENYQKIYHSKQSVRFPHEVWVKGVSGQ